MVSTSLPERLDAVAQRYDREYRGETVEVPEAVEALPVFQDWIAGRLSSRIASPFWEVAKPKKSQICLDIGCGGSFLFYPWREWDARFYGQDLSTAICQMVNARGSQLNSKLYKGMRQAAAHQLDVYEPNQFDLAIATGVSCYYDWDYWDIVLSAVKKVLKPTGSFVFDVIDPEASLAEDWAILEMYLGAEVELTSIQDWKKRLKGAGVKIQKEKEGELFHLFKVSFP
ncbi:class I SAM-dependent methyltransferase [Oscillatoria sp. CS-180]|uniref:class I SAM-dependent methyltransferase n=1 Tax=Oscillatoria sp. CS-180 TaxID=3021720 RepID=UPI00232E3D33|nr:class I SAM-dependent methyltransferase [Oscillatoria sp. CS-180]MDB9527780.1 class I SAM-dependent methyltransferase [Oscillatoria sp. CS-180]